MSYRHLTMDQRNVIYRMRFLGHTDAEIARCLGCHRSTIGRECKRNASPEGRCDAGAAQTRAHLRRRAICGGPRPAIPA
jgi:IS30 family transposase